MKLPKSILMASVILTGLIITTSSQAQDPKKWTAPKEADALKNPLKDNALATAAGKKLYMQMCSICHGDSGKGDGAAGAALNPRPGNFTTQNIQGQTDGAVFWKITNGKPPMAAYKDILKEEQRWQLVNYIRELGKATAVKKKVTPVQPKTDAAKTNIIQTDATMMSIIKADIIKTDTTKTEIMKKASTTLAAAPILISTSASAQETQSTINQENLAKSGNTKFLMSGYGFTGMAVEGDEEISFGETGFNPIFMWKHSDKLFIESELEVGLEDGETEIGLEYFNIQYILNKYMTLRAGKFLSPFGTFSERLHPSWINKSLSKPLGFGMMDAVGPGNEMGLDLRGGFQLGKSKMNYSLYASNGPTFNDGSDDPMMAGTLNYNKNFSDNNKNKALGGRLGFLPFPNSSLEIGFSGQSAKVGKADRMFNNMIDTTLADVNALMYAVDLSFVKSISSLKSIIDIKGQLNNVSVDKAELKDPMDTTGTMTYTFNNVSRASYIQFAFRPALVENKFLKNTEVVARYASLNLPEKSQWGGKKSQLALGLNYWLSWRSAIKFAYETVTQDGKAEEPRYLIQWAIAF